MEESCAAYYKIKSINITTQNTKSSPFLFWLLGIYAVLFSMLAINPIDRPTWFVENLTVWIILAVIVGLYTKGVRFSKTACSFMFVLIYLHTIGGHYTFALVPEEIPYGNNRK